MFAQGSELEHEKWAQSIVNRGFHYERGVKLENFYTLIQSGVLFKKKICSLCALRFRDIYLLWFRSFILI